MSPTARPSRRALLATVAGTSLVSSGLLGGTYAALSDTASDGGTLESGIWGLGARVTYTDGGTLATLTRSGGETTPGVSGVDALGPVETGFDGSDYHVPVVDGGGTLSLVAADGTETVLDIGSKNPPRGKKTILATATWNGHPLSVYYPGNNESKLYRVAPGGKAKRISKPSNGVKAALGAGDVDGDGVAEFVFVDGSGTVRYIVPSGSNNERDIRSTGVSPGANNNFGAGPPASVEGYGVVVPAVNGSGGLGLLDAGGWAEKSLTSGSTAAKTALALVDYDGDEANDVVFVDASSGELRRLDDVGGTNDVTTVTDDSGDPVPVDSKRGVM